MSFGSSPEVNLINSGQLINTGTINNAKASTSADLAVAYEQGSFTAQAEALKTWVSRTKNNLNSLSFNGYYATVSYFLTGESRVYSFPSGAFVGITPVNSRLGAWQLAARYSMLNLNSQNIKGGKEKNITLGINYYPINDIELSANYVRTNANVCDVNTKDNIYALQAQFTF